MVYSGGGTAMLPNIFTEAQLSQNERMYNDERLNQIFYLGDTWQTWIGPLPDPGDPKYSEILLDLQRTFQRGNKIKECSDRHVESLIGKFPLFNVSQGEEKDSDTTEVLESFLDWVSELAAGMVVEQGDPWLQCVTDMVVRGRGYLRIWAPDQFAANADPWQKLCLHAPDPSTVNVARDEYGIISRIEYLYGAYKETQALNIATGLLDFTIEDITGNEDDRNFTLDLGGMYTIYELRCPSLITNHVRDAQNVLNLSLTVATRNLISAGYRERVLFNAQMPGTWVSDLSAPSGERFVPDTKGFQFGPSKTTNLVGIPHGEPTNPDYTQPGIHYAEPVDLTHIEEMANKAERVIYEAFSQSHMSGNSSQMQSGHSRVQQRQDFDTKITRHTKPIQYAVRSIMMVGLRMIGLISGQDYSKVNVSVEVQTTAQDVTPDEMQQVIAGYQAGVVSLPTAIATLQYVDDVDLEINLIEEEAQQKMEQAQQMQQSAQEGDSSEPPGSNSDSPHKVLADAMGINPQQALKIMGDGGKPNVQK